MHKNTIIVVIILALAAVLVIGVNLGRKISSGEQNPTIMPESTSATPEATPTSGPVLYSSAECGVSLTHPASFEEIVTPGTPGTVFVQKSENGQSIVLTCQKDIPRSPLPPDKIETIKIGSVNAKLYHDASPKDGAPIDLLIFKHPRKNVDVYLAGMGSAFDEIVSSLKIL